MGKYLPNDKGFSKRTEKTTSVKRSILIVTEGTKTETIYFNWLRKNFRLTSVNIKTIGVGGGPLTVANYALEQYKATKSYDIVYCLMDRDKHPRDHFIKVRDQLLKNQHKKIFRIIPSYPCFEYWFILHFANDNNPYTQPIDGKGSMGSTCKNKLKSQYYQLYDEGSQEVLETLFNTKFTDTKRINAINRAVISFNNINTISSINPSTLVFLPAIDIELMANPALAQNLDKPIMQEVSQEHYEQYINEFFDIFIQQKNL